MKHYHHRHHRLLFRELGLFLLLWALLALLFAISVQGAHGAEPPARFFHALHQVEGSGRLNPPDGDGGRSIGPLQITRAYWLDSRVPGRYEDCRDLAYSRRVVTAYLNRYCPGAVRAGDFETMARTHNGGPTGPRKTATLDHWRKMKGHL